MDLTDQTLSGINEIHLSNSLNAPLMKLKVKMATGSVAPNINDVIIYVDKNASSNPTEDRKEYVLNLSAPLRYLNNVGDELVEQIEINNAKVYFTAYVERFVSDDGNNILENSIKEDVDSVPITLFEGDNYIYTNYENVDIELVYPKNDDLNKMFLSNVIFAEYSKYENECLNLDDIYFKDAFTKTSNQLNLEVNHATIDCLNSKNNAFSLDAEGNLTVNSITSRINNSSLSIDMDVIRDFVYPVGSLYISSENVSPENLFGGSWERINGYYLYAGTGGTTNGSNTSGAPNTNSTGSTVLTLNQIPSHSHMVTTWRNYGNTGTAFTGTKISNTRNDADGGNTNTSTQNSGGGQGHTHTLNLHTHTVEPLRYEVYMWKRIA